MNIKKGELCLYYINTFYISGALTVIRFPVGCHTDFHTDMMLTHQGFFRK